jgi:hypothetical protein
VHCCCLRAFRGPERAATSHDRAASPPRSISLGYHCAARLSSPRRLALRCYVRSGWNEADTSENDLRVTLWSFMRARAIPLD